MAASLVLTDTLASVPAAQWDALHGSDNPFVQHAFLSGLEQSGCLRPAWGWTPCHALLQRDGELIAAAPAYRKDNSHGEFIFDHAWAAAFVQTGRDYFPKWLVAVPYSPVTGPRLLAASDEARQQLVVAMQRQCQAWGWSSLHVNFLPEEETGALDDSWLARLDVQFHWHHQGWRDFPDFLNAMTHKRRKAIRQERERVRRDGYSFRIVHGDEASAEDLAAMHDFYCLTFADKGNSPALTLAFFQHLARTMPRALVLILAEHEGRSVAGALCLRSADTLYGRYWGSEHQSPGLHFETCYYQGIDYCLREGLQRFEPGAQGEHKLARGFLPELTYSRHFVAHSAFAQALAPWCASEREQVLRYRDLLQQHSPFRDASATP